MFDISFMELLVISMVALIVIGPERLPAVARTLGHLYGRLRSFVYSIRTDIHNEIRMEELKKIEASMHETAQSIEDSVQQSTSHLRATIDQAASEEATVTDQSLSGNGTERHPLADNSGSTHNPVEKKENNN